jgi:NhaP-type Na+/H+ or K+/H+ antiporter
VVVFVLNVLAFILVGLQLGPILQRLDRPHLLDYLATAAAVCAVVIIVRMLWALAYALAEYSPRRQPLPRSAPRDSFRSAIAIGWSGMRGIVTLAAGLALPARFPARDLVLFSAFCVVLVTLVLQGGTLAPLMRLLGLRDDGAVEGEIERARAETARAGLEALRGTQGSGMTSLLIRKYEWRLRSGRGSRTEAADEVDEGPAYADALRRAYAAERRKLIELRDSGVIGDDAFHRVEEELDWADMHAQAQFGTA